jgi:hypothetical protein
VPAAEKLVTLALLTTEMDVDVAAEALGDVITPKAKIKIAIALTVENSRQQALLNAALPLSTLTNFALAIKHLSKGFLKYYETKSTFARTKSLRSTN